MAHPDGWRGCKVCGLTPPVIKQIRGEAFRQLPELVMSDRDADRTVD